MNQTDHIQALADFLERHPKTLLLTGAGLSTASGIPDYRDKEGVRRGNAPLQGPDFRRSEAVRKRYWARSMAGWPTMAGVAPNAGHRAIADLAAAGRLSGIVTQNVDGLQQRAGCTDVIELHGNIHAVVCTACGARFARALIQARLEAANPAMANLAALPAPDGDAHLEPASLSDFAVPACDACAGMLQPDVVFFGDGVPRERTAATEQKLDQADALLVVGSSLVVFSGYRLCKIAAGSGKAVAALNLGKMRADPLLALKIEASAEHILPALAARLGANGNFHIATL